MSAAIAVSTIARRSVSTLQDPILVAVQRGIGSITMERLVMVSQGINNYVYSPPPIDDVYSIL